MSEDTSVLEPSIKVKSATVVYLIIGVLLWGVGESLYHIVQDGFQWEMLILMIPIGLLNLFTFSMLHAYVNRKEFTIYRLEKKGIIDFDSLQQQYIEIADMAGHLFFVKEDEYFSFRDFKILGSLQGYLPK